MRAKCEKKSDSDMDVMSWNYLTLFLVFETETHS